MTPTMMLEAAAVVLAIAYLVLAIRENIWCWAAGAASAALYLVLLARAALYMESALQVFYIAMSAYGAYCWNRPRAELPIRTWPLARHALALGAIGALALASGALLDAGTDAALPYLDAGIAWGSIFTTWMVARKLLENWLYWFVLDALSVYVYLERELPLTAALFGLYLVLIVAGFLTWQRQWRLQPA